MSKIAATLLTTESQTRTLVSLWGMRHAHAMTIEGKPIRDDFPFERGGCDSEAIDPHANVPWSSLGADQRRPAAP